MTMSIARSFPVYTRKSGRTCREARAEPTRRTLERRVLCADARLGLECVRFEVEDATRGVSIVSRSRRHGRPGRGARRATPRCQEMRVRRMGTPRARRRVGRSPRTRGRVPWRRTRRRRGRAAAAPPNSGLDPIRTDVEDVCLVRGVEQVDMAGVHVHGRSQPGFCGAVQVRGGNRTNPSSRPRGMGAARPNNLVDVRADHPHEIANAHVMGAHAMLIGQNFVLQRLAALSTASISSMAIPSASRGISEPAPCLRRGE